MKIGDLVRNKNAHRLTNESLGVFLGMRTFEGHYDAKSYTCALVAWFGGRTSPIQTSLLEVVSGTP